MISKLKTEHYHNRVSGSRGDSSATWKIIGEIVPNQKRKPNTYTFDNLGEKAEEFNVFFSKVGQNTYKRSQELLQNEEILPFSQHCSIADTNSAFRAKPVDSNTIILTIKSLNSTSSIGSDDISLPTVP